MRALLVAASAVALFVAVPGVGAAEPTKSILPVQLTCGGKTFDVVVPARGGAVAGLVRGSTSVAVLKGFEGEFIVPGFSESELTRCTALFPDGSSAVIFVLLTPRR